MSMRNMVIVGLAGALIALLIVMLSGKEPSTPEERVRATIDEIVGAANQQDIGGVLALVSEDFGGAGGMDRDRLRGILFMEFRRGAWTKVVLYDTDVVMQSETLADVRTRAVLARGDGPVPSNADSWDLELTLEEARDGQWRVVRGSYTSARRGR